jgi:hypothetical protein
MRAGCAFVGPQITMRCICCLHKLVCAPVSRRGGFWLQRRICSTGLLHSKRLEAARVSCVRNQLGYSAMIPAVRSAV